MSKSKDYRTSFLLYLQHQKVDIEKFYNNYDKFFEENNKKDAENLKKDTENLELFRNYITI